MSPPKSKQQKQSDDMDSRLSLLEYQFSEVQKSLERIEQKQDSAIRQIDTLKYVSTHEFESYTKDATKVFAAKDELKANTRLLYWLLGLLGSVFLLGVAAFIGLVVHK